MTKPFAPRSSWPINFPTVVIHSTVKKRDQHPAYASAKAGDFKAAISLVNDLLNPDALNLLGQNIGYCDVMLAAVTAVEKAGFNAIPDAMAHIIGGKMEWLTDTRELRQTNFVAHTRASGWHRIVTPPTFGGNVEKGRAYVLVDDHVGLGGTLANMRGYIEAKGGKVIAMTTLTESREASKISLSLPTLNMLRLKHGKELEQYWQEIFGYGLDCLTEIEASYIARQPSLDAIARCLADGTEKASGSGVSTISIPKP